jgi:hypothetical protein
MQESLGGRRGAVGCFVFVPWDISSIGPSASSTTSELRELGTPGQ